MKIDKIQLFTAPSWCYPCRAFHHVFEALTNDATFNECTFEVKNLDDSEENEALAQQMNVKGVPTTIILDNEGNEIQRIVGAVDLKEIKDILVNLLHGN